MSLTFQQMQQQEQPFDINRTETSPSPMTQKTGVTVQVYAESPIKPHHIEIPNLELEVKDILSNVYENQSQAIQSRSDSAQSSSPPGLNQGDLDGFVDQNIGLLPQPLSPDDEKARLESLIQ